MSGAFADRLSALQASINRAQALCRSGETQSVSPHFSERSWLEQETSGALGRLEQTVKVVRSSRELNENNFISICNELMRSVRRHGPVEEVVEVVVAMSAVHCCVNDPVLNNEDFWMQIGPLLVHDHERHRRISSGLYDDMAYNYTRQHIAALYLEHQDIDVVIDWLKLQPLLESEVGSHTLATAVIQFIEWLPRFSPHKLSDGEFATLSAAFPDNGPIQRKLAQVRATD